jgi:hypothetical protein
MMTFQPTASNTPLTRSAPAASQGFGMGFSSFNLGSGSFNGPGMNTLRNPVMGPSGGSRTMANPTPFNPNLAYGAGNASAYSNPYTMSAGFSLGANSYGASADDAGSSPDGADYGSAGDSYSSKPYSSSSSYSDPVAEDSREADDDVAAQDRVVAIPRPSTLLKQQRKQARIENMRRVFDDYLYEGQKPPAAKDERERPTRVDRRRSLNEPLVAEIESATALNTVLNDAIKLQATGIAGPTVYLDKKMLGQINVTAGAGRGHAGLLKDDGRLRWPVALRDDVSRAAVEVIDADLPEAVRDTLSGRRDATLIRSLKRARHQLARGLTARAKAVPMSQYNEAKIFLGNLADALRLLEQGQAARYLSGELAAQGRTVDDLVKFMQAKWLSFAPAVDGQEAAYATLYQALAAYDAGARNQTAQVTKGR